ncbi:hypothetical protein HF576_12760 [Microbacterium sp. CFH 90308]|uniref:Uncharacterized protein n=1 Tax=Microbacterium salsuginis TaxID=2722803 RepID=A0ABX1KEI9_9MICO|nr:hypothetical protein [Microbacterium sp. CFH 90308]NLP84723.1 hypothetical protein [Microbacterium sp. CFH 90308]
MSREPDDELRALRKRAYGRDADIDGDPIALRRLRELEEEAHRRLPDGPEPGERAATPADSDAPATTPAAGIRSPVDPLTTEDAAVLVSAQDDGPDSALVDPAAERADGVAEPVDGAGESAKSSSPAWWRRRSTLLWSAAVVGALVVGAAAALWVSQQQGRVAVLQQADVEDWPRNVVGEPPDGSRLFEDFLGLTVVIMPQSFGGGDETECLYVLESGGQGFMSTIGCSAGGFPATAALAVTARAPDELRERFADGTALQFVLTDSQVHVYADEP